MSTIAPGTRYGYVTVREANKVGKTDTKHGYTEYKLHCDLCKSDKTIRASAFNARVAYWQRDPTKVFSCSSTCRRQNMPKIAGSLEVKIGAELVAVKAILKGSGLVSLRGLVPKGLYRNIVRGETTEQAAAEQVKQILLTTIGVADMLLARLGYDTGKELDDFWKPIYAAYGYEYNAAFGYDPTAELDAQIASRAAKIVETVERA